MARKKHEAKPTWLQKMVMIISFIIILCSLFMVILQTAEVIPSDNPIFSHLLFSSMSALLGYLFGNNVKISI